MVSSQSSVVSCQRRLPELEFFLAAPAQSPDESFYVASLTKIVDIEELIPPFRVDLDNLNPVVFADPSFDLKFTTSNSLILENPNGGIIFCKKNPLSKSVNR